MLRYGQDYVDIGEKAYEAARGLGYTWSRSRFEPIAEIKKLKASR